jgi:outer membrane protein OmpA-like peptidoglycan-associated protein
MSRGAVVAAIVIILTAGACARRPVLLSAPAPPPPPARPDLYVVLPGRDGTVGAITVVHGTDQRVLADAYAGLRITADGRAEPGRISEQEVRAVFGAALDAQPPPATSFILHFTFGTDQLTADSSRALSDVMDEVRRRPDPEVVIVGHTDRVGGLAQNDALSLQRAERVRQSIIGLGLPSERVQAVGRGEREPLVPTDDEVPEPRNRRVEVTVR